MGSESSTVPVPISHVVQPCNLKEGDHIYRRLNGVGAVVGYHHGVVSYVPAQAHTEDISEHIRVIEMTRKHGIRESTLSTFLNGWDCRLVYYNASKSAQMWHVRGTCHVELASAIEKIRARIKEVLQPSFARSELYSLFGNNCEEIAIWIKTGLYHGTEYSQVKAVRMVRDDVVGQSAITATTPASRTVANRWQLAKSSANLAEAESAEATKAIIKETDIIAAANAGTKVATECTLECGGEIVASNSIRTASIEATKKSAYTKLAAGLAVGVAVGIEAALTAHKIYKYKTDYEYTKGDLKRDLARSWITASATTSLGIVLMPWGWWALIPCVALGTVMNWAFSHWNVFDKSTKEKVYADFDLNEKSSTEELREIRRKIKRMIFEEKLHPDQYNNLDLKEKEQKRRLAKFVWCHMLMEYLDDDIARGYVQFPDINQEKKTMQAIMSK